MYYFEILFQQILQVQKWIQDHEYSIYTDHRIPINDQTIYWNLYIEKQPNACTCVLVAFISSNALNIWNILGECGENLCDKDGFVHAISLISAQTLGEKGL